MFSEFIFLFGFVLMIAGIITAPFDPDDGEVKVLLMFGILRGDLFPILPPREKESTQHFVMRILLITGGFLLIMASGNNL